MDWFTLLLLLGFPGTLAVVVIVLLLVDLHYLQKDLKRINDLRRTEEL